MSNIQNHTKALAITAMLTALVVATGYIPAIPLGIGNVYWCDSMILFAAFLIAPINSFFVGGVGTFLYDILRGNAAMALPSFVIHGVQAFVVSFLLHKVFPKSREPLWATISSFFGSLIVIGGYFIFRTFIAGGEKSGLAYAIGKIPANIAQELLCSILALLLCYAAHLKYTLMKNNLLPNESAPQASK